MACLSLPLSLAPTQNVVHRKSMQAGAELRLTLEGAQPAPGANENLLRELFCRLLIDHPHTQSEDPPHVVPIQPFERRVVSRRGSVNISCLEVSSHVCAQGSSVATVRLRLVRMR